MVIPLLLLFMESGRRSKIFGNEPLVGLYGR